MNTNLDCNTKKGRVALKDQRIAVDAVLRHLSEERISAVHTVEPAKVDCFFVTPEDEMFAVAEVKTRYDLTIEKLQGEFSNTWLISADKLKAMQTVCILTNVIGYGILYLKDSSLLLMIQLYDATGMPVMRWNERETVTQANINGGEALRWNAYIPMGTSEIIPV